MARGPKKPRWFGKKRRGPTHNQKKSKIPKPGREKMLDMGEERYFRFDLTDILEKSSNEDNIESFKANISVKASQLSIPDAKEYVNELSENGLEREISEEIIQLLDRYSTYR